MEAVMSPQEVMDCFKKFMDGVSKKCGRPPRNLVDSSLILLKALPASREAVLDYLSTIHKDFFREYLSKPDKVEHEENTTIRKIEAVSTELVNSEDSSFWSIMLSKWCIKTLGDMSQDFANHKMLPVTTNLSTLQELIKFWTSCLASQSLVNILSTCLSNLNEDEMYPCFDSLLVNSMKFSPHFDWVVAYTGSRFPNSIINRMLQCGLTDYHQNASVPLQTSKQPQHPIMPPSARLFQTQVQGPPPRISQASSSTSTDSELENISRVPSVVGILSHLALDYEDELKERIVSLFQRSMNEEMTNEYMIGPLYIFHLASQSSHLFKVTSRAFLDNIDMATINKLFERAQRRNFKNYISYISAINLMARTLIRTESNGFEIIKFFMDTAVSNHKGDKQMMKICGEVQPLPAVFQFCFEVMNELCTIMQKLVFSSSTKLNPDVKILTNLREHKEQICHLLIKSKDSRRNWLFKFLSCLCVGDTRETSFTILSNVFLLIPEVQELSIFVELQKCCEIRHVNVISDCVDAIFVALQDLNLRQQVIKKMLALVNLETDTEVTSKNKELLHRQPLNKFLQSKHLPLVHLFRSSDYNTRHDLLKLLILLGPPQTSKDVTTPLKIAREAVTSFFDVLKEYEDDEKSVLAYDWIKYLKLLLLNKAVQMAIVVWTLESALSPEKTSLFGGARGQDVNHFHDTGNWLEPLFSRPDLMEQNRIISNSSVQLFHSGEIASKPKRMKASDPTPEIRLNSRLVLEVVWSCGCLTSNKFPPIREREDTQCSDVMKAVTSIIVEFVMPDSLLNSVQWPEEDFLKTSAERDLYVRRKFDCNPLIWHLLDMVTISPSSSWSCLCILRSLLGNLIVQWESSRESSSRSLPQLLSMTQKVIENLRKTQVLLEPLSYSVELVPLISPYEVHLLLINIWRYIKEYCPQTGIKKAFVCPPKILDVVHSIMQNNIESCGHIYPLFFSA